MKSLLLICSTSRDNPHEEPDNNDDDWFWVALLYKLSALNWLLETTPEQEDG
jgi:hypothetical protein